MDDKTYLKIVLLRFCQIVREMHLVKFLLFAYSNIP